MIKERIKKIIRLVIYKLLCILPLQDKVVGSSFYGNKYENNARYVVEALHEIDPKIKIVWRKAKKADFVLPTYIIPCSGILKEIYEYATAKVWIDSHQLPGYLKKRKGQFCIIAWHGGMGIKKIANDAVGRNKSELPKHTAENADLFISNSDYRNTIIRKALMFNGPIWKCGYPKNDLLCGENTNYKERVCSILGVSIKTKIILYAPTYRLNQDIIEPFMIDFKKLKEALSNKTKEEWVSIVHWHPSQKSIIEKTCELYRGELIDLTSEDMQLLTMACDIFISDYSSGIFDAAIRKIPCFIYASDYEQYKRTPGVYYDIKELPFPFAEDNDELLRNIMTFSNEKYQEDLERFNIEHGIIETGRASENIAKLVRKFIYSEDFVLEKHIP